MTRNKHQNNQFYFFDRQNLILYGNIILLDGIFELLHIVL